MKKTLVLSCLLMAGSAFAQQVHKASLGNLSPAVVLHSATKPSVQAQALSAAPFFSEDFANGIPAGWTNTGSPAAALWEYRPDTIGIRGSRGAISKKLSFIKSSTNYNGYVIFDSDYLDNKGGAAGTGPAPAPHKGVLKTSAINCSGHPSVILKFNQFKAYFAGLTTVTVSNGTVQNVYTIDGNLDINTYNARNSVTTLNISTEAGNQANVTLAFTFDGTVTVPGANGQGYYFWQIDDIQLMDGLVNDLVMEDDGLGFKSRLGYYCQTPAYQQKDSLTFTGDIFNNGSAAQHNVKLSTNVRFNSTPVYSRSFLFKKGSSFGAPAFGSNIDDSRDSTTVSDKVSITPNGTYTVTLSVKSDETDNDTTNNTRVHTFITSDTTFARDNGFISKTSGTSSYLSYGSDQDGFQIANVYEMHRNDKVSSVSVYMAKGSTAGSRIKAVLYKSDRTSLINQSNDYILTPQDTSGKLITLVFDKTDPTLLRVDKDSMYYAAVYTYAQPAGKKVLFADDNTVLQPNGVSLTYLPGSAPNPAGWYGNGNAYILRLNMVKDTLITNVPHIAGKGFSTGQNIPNPFSHTSVISYTLDRSAAVSFQVFDITGRKVADSSEGYKEAGTYSIVLDAARLGKGIYMYTVKAGEHSITKKMVITE